MVNCSCNWWNQDYTPSSVPDEPNRLAAQSKKTRPKFSRWFFGAYEGPDRRGKKTSAFHMTTEGLSPAARAQRLSLGVLTLLLVDIIWVGSSELTEYIFKQQNFNKPFFSTYLKTSLFMLYLPGFLVHRPWRDQCRAGLARRQERRGEGYTR